MKVAKPKREWRQTNINMPMETYEKLKLMMISEGRFSRSAFVSDLIDREYHRRLSGKGDSKDEKA